MKFKFTRQLTTLAFFALSGCALTGQVPIVAQVAGPDVTRLPSLYVTGLNVNVPRSLKVSESLGYYPNGDIVWHGDASGDRYVQVENIFRGGLGQVTDQMTGDLPIEIDIEVTKFHALTPKARYTIGGMHAISFDLTVRNSETGDVILPTRSIKANLRGLGGTEALMAESQGRTQKVRIQEHLAAVILAQLTGKPYIPPA